MQFFTPPNSRHPHLITVLVSRNTDQDDFPIMLSILQNRVSGSSCVYLATGAGKTMYSIWLYM